MKTLNEIKELASAVLSEVENLEKRYTKTGGKRLRKALDELGKARVRIKREIIEHEKAITKTK
jgi:DNA-directed RNA polymerase subunit N (RpoN/RPB10)